MPVSTEASGLPYAARAARIDVPRSLRILTVPGLHGSGPEHWQSRWERRYPDWTRVRQKDWGRPSLHLWAERVMETVAEARPTAAHRVLLVAHSFGCLATLRHAAIDAEGIAGALLVAPADPDKFGVGPLLPAYRMPFPTIVVASRDDPWMKQRTAFSWGALWGSELVDAGATGHINADSGLDDWEPGLALLDTLIQRIESRHGAHGGSASDCAKARQWETGIEVQPTIPYI